MTIVADLYSFWNFNLAAFYEHSQNVNILYILGAQGLAKPTYFCVTTHNDPNNVQEFKAQQSRHSSLSPHGWLDPEEEQELDSDASDDEEEYYNQQYGHAIDG